MRKPLPRAIPVALLALASTLPLQAADPAKDLAQTPQAKIYQALLKAVAAGDYEAYKKCMTKASVEAMERDSKESGLDPKKAMGILKEMAPTKLQFTSLKVDGKKTTLDATGVVFEQPNVGTIELEQEDGQWKIVKQSWSNKK